MWPALAGFYQCCISQSNATFISTVDVMNVCSGTFGQGRRPRPTSKDSLVVLVGVAVIVVNFVFVAVVSFLLPVA